MDDNVCCFALFLAGIGVGASLFSAPLAKPIRSYTYSAVLCTSIGESTLITKATAAETFTSVHVDLLFVTGIFIAYGT